MKFRLTPKAKLSLAALLFALAALLAFTNGDSSWRSKFAGSKVFPDLDPDSVTEIDMSSGKLQLTLSKASGIWTVKQRDGHPADMARISSTISAITAMKSARQLEDISACELKELGLDSSAPAGPILRLTGAKGAKLAELTLGHGFFKGGGVPSPQERPDGRYCLASVSSGQGVPLLSSSLFDWLELQPGKWLEAPSFDITKALSVKVWTSKSGSWSMSRPSLKDQFALDLPLKGVPSPKAVASLVAALSKPPILDLAPSDIASEISLTETLTVSIALEGGSSVDLTFGVGSSRAIMKSSISGQTSKWTYETGPQFVQALASPPPQDPAP